jgi:succinoglycan biosynthesis protein ExoM
MKTMRIAVCVCTYRRPGVADTLRSVLEQQGGSSSELEIIVADDDPLLSGRETVSRIAEQAAIPIRYVASGAQNIAACRNTCLQAATADWIAFIDDDQIAEPGWLREMILTANRYKADAVKCAVRGMYPAGRSDWIRAGDPYTYDYGETGAEVIFAAAGGILFRRNLPGAEELFFDLSLGITGGEDFEYFLRYRGLGGKVVSSREAVAIEVVPPDRVAPTYLRRRSRRHGHINGRVLFAKEALPRRSVSILRSIVGVALTFAYPAVRAFNGAVACWMFMKFWYHFGVLEWALGRDAFGHE